MKVHFKVASINGANQITESPTRLLAYFVSNVRHAQWAIPQTGNEGSMFIHVRAFLLFSPG